MDVDLKKDDGESISQVQSNGRQWRLVIVVVVAVIVAVSLCVIALFGGGHHGRTGDSSEVFVKMDYQGMVAQNIFLPYDCDMKGDKNTLKIHLDKVESVYVQDNRLVVVVYGFARLVGDETLCEKASCEVLLTYSSQIAFTAGKLVIADRLLEKFEAYSSDPNVGAIMETHTMEFWRSFLGAMKPWELPVAVPFQPKESVQLELDGLFVHEE